MWERRFRNQLEFTELTPATAVADSTFGFVLGSNALTVSMMASAQDMTRSLLISLIATKLQNRFLTDAGTLERPRAITYGRYFETGFLREY